jgi:hypothetical protein
MLTQEEAAPFYPLGLRFQAGDFFFSFNTGERIFQKVCTLSNEFGRIMPFPLQKTRED